MKTLRIKPDGHLIKSGVIAYNFDENGTIDFSIDVTAHYLFSDHKISQNGTYHVDPDLLKSAKVKPGEVFSMGKVKLSITEVTGKTAEAHVEIEDLGAGFAWISLTGKLIQLDSIRAWGSVYGQSVKLETV